jgi:hypothetical protein
VAPAGHGSPDLRVLELGSEPWVALIGTGHRLAGIGPVAAKDLDGASIAVSGHRDGAAFDRAVHDLVGELGVATELVSTGPGPALQAAVAENEVLALTTAPECLLAGVMARRLDSPRTLAFELLTRDEIPSPALAGFIASAAATAQRAPARSLAAVA